MSSDFTISSDNLKKILYELLSYVNVDPTQIESQVSKALSAEIIYAPIRHNSPGSALLVKKCIEFYKPKLVLIEGPLLADNLIPYMVEIDTIPPFAILSIFSDVTNKFGMNGIMSPDISVPSKFEVHYPFISYSPELIAIKECHKREIPTKFIDLPLTGLIPSMIREEENYLHIFKQEENQFTLSSFYKTLSQAFQFDSFHETWDSLFEIGANRAEINELRESLMIFCSCIRATIPNEIKELSGSMNREQFMKFNIEKYIKQYGVKEKETLVITGGLHSVVLNDIKKKNIKFPTKGL